MAQRNEADGRVPVLAPPVLTSDPRPDDVAIFTPPALGVVFHWWVESNRRWTETNRRQALRVDTVAPGEAEYLSAVQLGTSTTGK